MINAFAAGANFICLLAMILSNHPIAALINLLGFIINMYFACKEQHLENGEGR